MVGSLLYLTEMYQTMCSPDSGSSASSWYYILWPVWRENRGVVDMLLVPQLNGSSLHINIPAYQHTSIPAYQHTSIPAYQHTSIPAYQHISIPAYQHTSIPAYQHTSISCMMLFVGYAPRQAKFKFHPLRFTTYGYTTVCNTSTSKTYPKHKLQLNLDQKLWSQTCCKLQTLVSRLVLTFGRSQISAYEDSLLRIHIGNPYGESL